VSHDAEADGLRGVPIFDGIDGLEAVRETETHIELTLTKLGPEFED
jgi:hypothetical protein